MEYQRPDPKSIKVGDYISFKSDVEQSARVIKIRHDGGWSGRAIAFVVEAPLDGFSGEYIRGLRITEIDGSDIF